MSTIRVSVNDTFTQSYALVSPSGTIADLTSATIVVDVITVDTDEIFTSIDCAVVAPTANGIVSFSVEDATPVAGMYILKFKVTDITGLVKTYPVNTDQGFLVT
jgi:hypothetical protein